MKLWKTVLLAAAVLLPRLGTPAVDVGRLEPVQTVQVIGSDTAVELRTDTGASGRGETISDAVENLKRAASKEIFLDTADYVLLWGQTPPIEQLLSHFRPACGVCRANPGMDLAAASAYLRQHPPARTLGELRAGLPETELLQITEGGGTLCRIPS